MIFLVFKWDFCSESPLKYPVVCKHAGRLLKEGIPGFNSETDTLTWCWSICASKCPGILLQDAQARVHLFTNRSVDFDTQVLRNLGRYLWSTKKPPKKGCLTDGLWLPWGMLPLCPSLVLWISIQRLGSLSRLNQISLKGLIKARTLGPKPRKLNAQRVSEKPRVCPGKLAKEKMKKSIPGRRQEGIVCLGKEGSMGSWARGTREGGGRRPDWEGWEKSCCSRLRPQLP